MYKIKENSKKRENYLPQKAKAALKGIAVI